MKRWKMLGLSLCLAFSAEAAPLRRIAVLVGAREAAAGRRPLRFSYQDARSMASVLTELGSFAAEDVHVLEDPEPAAVLTALDLALAEAHKSREAMVVFYYSGHADDQALYPHGQPLAMAALRERLDQATATIRVGIIDACRGGGWTRAKGFSAEEPFAVQAPLELSSEGSVLIASSSGLEDAHEAESLGGSFFTHYLVAGLRGAADSGSGRVTLQEAYTYAQRMTVRDTALHAPSPQRPSFDSHLRGQADVVLAQLTQSPSALSYGQVTGPTQLVQVQSGLVVLEVPPGERRVKLALPPGDYVVRREGTKGLYAREVKIIASQTLTLEEESLELVGSSAFATKRFEKPLAAASTSLPRGSKELQMALGVSHASAPSGLNLTPNSGLDTAFSINYGITDRLEVSLLNPSLAYRFGERGGLELLPWAGMVKWGFGFNNVESSAFSMTLAAGLQARKWLSFDKAFNFGVDVHSSGLWSRLRTQQLDNLSGQLSAGYSQTVAEMVTFNIGTGFSVPLVTSSQVRDIPGHQDSHWLSFGSVQTNAFRSLPLVQIHLREAVSLDAHANIAVNLTDGQVLETYMAGATFNY